MKAAIVAIGDEIVGGITVDTNTAEIAEAVRTAGFEPVGSFSAADEEGAIVRAFERAMQDAEVVIATGGLGPTADDLTTACVARVGGRELVLDAESLATLEERFRTRGIELTPNNRKQVYFPSGSEIIPNPTGSAPGFVMSVDREGGTRHILCLPGVPREMRRMLAESVVPWLKSRHDGQSFASRTFSVFGIGESKLDELLVGVVSPGEARLAFRAAFPHLQARATVAGRQDEGLEGRLDAIETRVRERLGPYLYAVGNQGMEETVGQLLKERNLKLAVAESCTGGLIGHRITDVPGSSEYFLLGVVAYSNEAKERLLGVRSETLDRSGAVSTESAEEMAEGVRRAANADLGLATTGIAGPGGGSAEKPVGTVCIAISWEGGCWSQRFDLGDRSREWIKSMTAQLALDTVRKHLLQLDGQPTF